ncbi:quinone oxidoreductase family protein [Leucobacter tenebrionis]|uniref:quinone oxidoreductase family protein n=1 Tax=Leucobacter tenebrionis TaxID=2873270 RepID=UPI001CA75D6B|nr:zinc-binding dehydrogenase [Leucobacter tenebrionis]QZY52629.1 zinc-binding dehydrogenase [Leucobacter tenebrionis]
MTETMRALIAGRGPEWVLADVPVPQPGAGEVLIRNRASASNNADMPMLAEADPSSGGSGDEFIAGYEYAGEIAAVGEDAGEWRIGDPVMGTYPSAFAEYLVVDHRFVLPRPLGLSPEIACALPTALLTEYGALRVAGFERGRSVLVTGATTGIGFIGVQLARTLGASRVIATTRSADKRDLLVSLGADDVVVTSEEDLTEAVLGATDGRGVDLVLDHIAGQTFAQCLPATAHDGHVVNIGRLAGPASTIDLDALSYRHLTVHGVSFGFSRDWETVPILDALHAQVLPAVERGEIRPVIDSSFACEDSLDAANRLRSGEAVGKVVLAFE